MNDQNDEVRWLGEPLELGIGERNRAMVEQEQAKQKEILSNTDCCMHWWMNHR